VSTLRGNTTAPVEATESQGADFLRTARGHVTGFLRGADRSGTRITHLYTAAVDNSMRRLFAEAKRDGLPGRFCLVATGGYARRALCTWSDVDVMLIADDSADVDLEEMARKLLYPLWDSGLDVGHHPGTIAEVLAAADGILTTQTALLELRFVTGDRSLYQELLEAVSEAVERWRGPLLERVRPENLARFARYGQSVFLLEPHVKEGKGGLRDFHWLSWIARLKYGARGDYDMLMDGLVEPHHYRALMDAYEFLMRVRLQLHVLHGRRQDRLIFESQEPVARALAFKGSGGLLAVERFMGEYYRQAYAMAHICGLYVARMLEFYWDEEEAREGPARRGAASSTAPVTRVSWSDQKASGDGLWVLHKGSVRCLDPEVLSSDPGNIMKLFEFVQAEGARLHHDSLEHVRGALGRIHKRYRHDPAISVRFLQILEGGDVFRTLVAMHRSGFLGRYIPDWGACFCQAQHNRLHLYTVDVHLLYTVRELEALGSSVLAEEQPEVHAAWLARESRAPLILAGLFHDIAKSHGSAHSRVGAEKVTALLNRMGMAESDIERVAWLVRHHLILSDTAYHRDLYDPRTQSDLAAVIPSRGHLDDLLALSWADARATNAASFTSWRQTLLVEAYRAALTAIEPGAGAARLQSPEQKRVQVEALLIPEVGRKRAGDLAALVFEVPVASQPRYLERTSSELLASHAALLAQHVAETSDNAAHRFVCHERYRPEWGVSQWMVCTGDQPGTFSTQAGVLAACGLSIISAAAVTRTDGTCINSFSVTDTRGRAVTDPGRWRRVQRMLGRVMEGEKDLEEVLAGVRDRSSVADSQDARMKRIKVSNEFSDLATLVEVVTTDRVGLVYDITRVFLDFGLDLQVAKISTRHDLASDAFYVVNRRGNKMGKRSRRALTAALRERFD